MKKEIKESLKSTQETKMLITNKAGDLVGVEKENITFNMDFNNITPMPKWVRTDGASFDKYEKYGKENYWFHWNINNGIALQQPVYNPLGLKYQ